MDEVVLHKVCARLKEWKEKGYPLFPVSVNLSRAVVPFVEGNGVPRIQAQSPYRIRRDTQRAQFGGGIRLPGKDGWAFLSPDDVQPEMCIMAEAGRYETADELCFFYAKQLEELAAKSND